MAQPETLENIFGAFVNQGTLEEAAEEMADLAKSDSELNQEFEVCLSEGVRLGASGSEAIAAAVNRSGYRVQTPKEAGEYCSELLSLYREAFNGQ